MEPKKPEKEKSFSEQLVLFHYFLNLLGMKHLSELGGRLNDAEYEGYDENQNTRFYGYLDYICASHPDKVKISRNKLQQYDDNICRHVKQIGERRGGITLKYFQYMTLLFTEIYLDRYFSDREAFAEELNEYLEQVKRESDGKISFAPYTAKNMNKLAVMCATGSGKTLIMHIHILQFLHYLKRAQRRNHHLNINKIIVLAPNEGMSLQHLEELQRSSISAEIFNKASGAAADVIIIDMNKLKEEGKVKTVSIDSFEQNNLVLVDEAHRGLAGDVWYEYRSRLSADGGFSFEYSATFKQALKKMTNKEDRRIVEEYCTSILMDYSYKYFYGDGYGKEYRIYNLQEGIDKEQKYLYLTGCLLSYYQQLKLYDTYAEEYAPFELQKPLLIFVGNRVTAKTSAAELTDVEEILDFINRFVSGGRISIDRIRTVLNGETGLTNGQNRIMFSQDFHALRSMFDGERQAEEIFKDMLCEVFHCETRTDEPRLYIDNLKLVPGEIALKIGAGGRYFGVISIADTAALVKNCFINGINTNSEEFITDSLFSTINDEESEMNILIGSRKFTEGWNSWRVSAMGLINFAKGEGSQAIQLFGRGVRLRGYHGCLKRSSRLEDSSVKIPRYIECLETLTVFGVQAQYMEDFKKYLEMEEVPANESLHQFSVPVASRCPSLREKRLRIIKVKNGASFNKTAPRFVLEAPEDSFLSLLVRNPVRIDCRSKVQMIESNTSLQMEDMPEENTLDDRCMPFLDYEYIYNELEAYKYQKNYFNISIEKNKLSDILKAQGWYSLLIPRSRVRVDSMAKLTMMNELSTMLLKGYMDRFYKYKKAEWETGHLEYQILTENDSNFVKEYKISYSQKYQEDNTVEEISEFAEKLAQKVNLEEEGREYQTGALQNRLTAINFRAHLYTPLLCLRGTVLNLQITPVSLNEDEKRFVDLLHRYMESEPQILKDKELYLLRNKSRSGMGFFEAGNFYPDFILWIDTPQKQYISFVDPKGLLRVEKDNLKIEFYRKIKELEQRLKPTAGDKEIILNSFIMSGTNSARLREWWKMERDEREARNVYCLDHPDCVERMIEKILGGGAL